MTRHRSRTREPLPPLTYDQIVALRYLKQAGATVREMNHLIGWSLATISKYTWDVVPRMVAPNEPDYNRHALARDVLSRLRRGLL